MCRPIGRAVGAVAILGAVSIASSAYSGHLFLFNDPSGLAAQAEFTLLNPTTLQIRLQNTSTGLPAGFDNSDQLLTGLSWDFGAAGVHAGDITITGGSAAIGGSSASVNFDTGSYGAGSDVGGEWGFGNTGISGALANAISGNQAGMTPFGGANLDGPVVLSGPQAGLVSSIFSVAMGGLGAIKDEIVVTVNLSAGITDAQLLLDLVNNGTRIEYGSDAAFLTGHLVPAPGALALIGLAGLARRRRRLA